MERPSMKSALVLVLASSMATLGGCAAARVYPTKGPLAATVPAPIYEAKMTNRGSSGNFSTMINGEKFAAPWHQVPRRNDPTSNPPVVVDPGNLAPEWDEIYGQGFYNNVVLPAHFYLRSEAVGNRGTKLVVEMYGNQKRPVEDPQIELVLKGVGKDDHGNTYKILFRGMS